MNFPLKHHFTKINYEKLLLPLKEVYRNDAAHKRNQNHYNYWKHDIAGCKAKACVF